MHKNSPPFSNIKEANNITTERTIFINNAWPKNGRWPIRDHKHAYTLAKFKMLNDLSDKANGRDQPTVFTFPAMRKSIYTQSVRTVKAQIESRQLGICITSKTIYGEGTPSRIYVTKIITGNTPVAIINNLTVIISFLIKRTGNPLH